MSRNIILWGRTQRRLIIVVASDWPPNQRNAKRVVEVARSSFIIVAVINLSGQDGDKIS